ncbi:carbohydrate sulfotransferase 8-like [Anopheles bellator]|uniref:carbohydrate sulfotransferase 8-like n=1 Tax=Anopheles bellator TaxID=139047 RepID=UPI002649ACD5|nr:carbohydrate sulfotransferase 8-like [Anopheles bellator]
MIVTNIRRLVRKTSSKLWKFTPQPAVNVSNLQGACTACIGVVVLLLLIVTVTLLCVRLRDRPPEEGVQDILEGRITHLRNACNRLDNGGHQSVHPAFYLHSKNNSLLYCLVFKAGTSSWFYNFNSWAGYTEYEIMHIDNLFLARKFYPQLTRSALMHSMEHSFSFLIVRHPFERLISAFEDRLVSMRNAYYSRVSRAIYERYHPGGTGVISFRDFVQFIIEDVAYSRDLDVHWCPVNNLCTPCLVRYDLIIKLETYAQDVEVLLRRTNLRDKIKPVHINHTRRDVVDRLIEKYFSQITQKQMDALYAIYEIDFMLFGYSAEKYFQVPKVPQ